MARPTPPDRTTLITLVLDHLRDALADRADTVGPVDASTRLIGERAVLESLALVTLIVDLEQRLADEYGVTLTIADDRATSVSP